MYAGGMHAEHCMLELAHHVLDILQNTVEAGATRVTLLIDEDQPSDRLIISVTEYSSLTQPPFALNWMGCL